MKSSLFKIWKSTIWYLKVTVDCDSSCGLISFITDKVTAKHIDGRPWETYQSGEFLIESIRDRFKSKNTLPQDETTMVDTEYAIHVSGNIKFC